MGVQAAIFNGRFMQILTDDKDPGKFENGELHGCGLLLSNLGEALFVCFFHILLSPIIYIM